MGNKSGRSDEANTLQASSHGSCNMGAYLDELQLMFLRCLRVATCTNKQNVCETVLYETGNDSMKIARNRTLWESTPITMMVING
eukprot:875045-Amphidinium_carterae.1